MNQYEHLQEYLEKFTEDQKDTIAEMAALDCVLSEIWQEHVTGCIKGKGWQPNVLLKALIERVQDVVTDIEQYDLFTDYGKLG